jgi:hypothetical protein
MYTVFIYLTKVNIEWSKNMNFIQFNYNILNVGHFFNLHKFNMSSIIDFSTGLVHFTHHTHNITLIVHASTRLDKIKYDQIKRPLMFVDR